MLLWFGDIVLWRDTLRILFLAFAACLISSFVAPADAARVTPMVLTLDEAGSGATARIEFENTEDKTLPMEARVFRGTISERGELSLEPADEDFLVFPPQTTVKPFGQQIFRVQYLGTEPLDTSEIYYLSIRQIPVQLEPGANKIQLVMNFNVLLNVVPDGATPKAVVDWIQPATREDKTGVEVRIVNEGTRFVAAGRRPWSVSGKNRDGSDYSETYSSEQVADMIGYGIVPPGGALIFFMETSEDLDTETVSINLGG